MLRGWFDRLTMTGHPFDTVRPEALEGTNGAQDRPELVEGSW